MIAASLSAGLQLAVSLKAENFPDTEGKYGKNMLNRVYELQDEVRSIHEYQPRAFIVGLFYYPIDACIDRTTGRSSFARLVAELRSRTGRNDLLSPTQLNRLDRSVVGLYVPSDLARIDFQTGATRYFDVMEAPPEHGRPKVESTMSLAELAEQLDQEFDREASKQITYADPESE
ncbi:MAG: hypothetical protein AAGI22_24515 [Planctomycetota bacterium]